MNSDMSELLWPVSFRLLRIWKDVKLSWIGTSHSIKSNKNFFFFWFYYLWPSIWPSIWEKNNCHTWVMSRDSSVSCDRFFTNICIVYTWHPYHLKKFTLIGLSVLEILGKGTFQWFGYYEFSGYWAKVLFKGSAIKYFKLLHSGIRYLKLCIYWRILSSNVYNVYVS